MLQPHGLALERRGVIAGRDDADLLLVELVEPERRRRPADIDLSRHHRRQVRGRPPIAVGFALSWYCFMKAVTMPCVEEPLVE